MKAVVFHGVGDIRLEEVKDPKIEAPTDAIVRLTASAICGTDLHMVRGTMTGMKKGTILGHEGVGIVEALGDDVRNLKVGDRVVLCSTIACGACSYCRAGWFAQCDEANPNGKLAGTAFFGGPATTGPFNGMQAEKVRVPFAHVVAVKVPDEVSDEQAILLSDIFPTGWFGAELADIKPGHTVVVFGCGPVGQFAIASAKLMGAGRVLAVDALEDRLDMARRQGAETINFNEEDPVEAVRRLTNGIGTDCAIDAVGVDAEPPTSGPAARQAKEEKKEFERQLEEIAPKQNPDGENWKPGRAPTQALEWAVQAVAKGGQIALIGVYPETVKSFPIGMAMMRNLTLRMGNCNHRKYIPQLLQLVRSGQFDPTQILTQQGPLVSAIEAYKAFDARQQGWVKVELTPQSDGAAEGEGIQPVQH